MDGNIRVLKRDGSIEPFNLSKLNSCIKSGFHASGEPVDRCAIASKGLAEAVHAYLRKKQPRTPVASEHLAELVELVLTQTGYCAAGMAIQQHIRSRDGQRRWIRVAGKRPRDGRFVQRRWNKSMIVHRLRTEHDLGATIARMIAGRVEQLVLNCGLKVVTTGLVREMTDSELLAWGLLPGALVVKKQKTRKSTETVQNPSDST